MTAQVYCDIRNKIYKQDNDAVITIHTKSQSHVSAPIGNIEYMGTYIIVDTESEAGTCFIPIEGIEFIQI